MNEQLREKLRDTHTILMQVKTCGDDSIAMAQGLLLLRQSLELAARLPEAPSQQEGEING